MSRVIQPLNWQCLVSWLPPENLPWRLLVISDDAQIQEAIRFGLADCELGGRSIELLQIGTMAEAANLMRGVDGWQRVAVDEDSPVRVYAYHPREDLRQSQLSFGAVFSSLLAGALRSRQLLGQVRSLACFDQLCRLPNRPMFINLLDEALGRGGAWVVAIADIDYFSSVTNALGYPLGDAMLRAVAGRLESAFKPRGYTLARINTDNFALLAPADSFDVQEILGLFADPVAVEDYELPVSITVGMVYADDAPERSGDAVLKCAATALKMAKHKARGAFRCFAPNMATQLEQRVQLVYDLKGALAQQRLEVHYQPQVALADGRPVGIEALVRWPHPQRGMIAPDLFIDIAEKTGLIVELGEFVLERACRDQVELQAAGCGCLRVAVNVSMIQFKSPRFLPALRRVIQQTGIRPQDLELEITESMVMNDVQTVISTLYEVKTLGVTVAIDDFGTGFSSLAHLHTLPIDRIKVDRSFVRDLDAGKPGGKIAEMIVSLGHTLDKRIIAEGIEQPSEVDILRHWGCHEGQGYFYGRPMPKSGLLDWLAAHAWKMAE